MHMLASEVGRNELGKKNHMWASGTAHFVTSAEKSAA